MSRETTNRLLEMVDDGVLNARTLALACLNYMSEDDVEDMAVINEFIPDPDDCEDEYDEADELYKEFGWDEYDKQSEEKSYPYIINAGDDVDDLCPLFAGESKDKAINLCKSTKFYKYLEVVYMPEDDPDTNEVVWRSWEVR